MVDILAHPEIPWNWVSLSKNHFTKDPKYIILAKSISQIFVS